MGSTYSYVSSYFASHLSMSRDFLDVPISVSIPVGDFIVVYRVYRSCVVTIMALIQ